MSHFVSTGANFDDLNAQLLQRRAADEEQDEAESSEQGNESSDDAEEKGGTIKGRPSSTASAHHSEDGSSKLGKLGITSRRPHPRHTPSSSNLSRKNSEEDLPAASTSGAAVGRNRKSYDQEVRNSRLSTLQRESDSPLSSRPTSPAQRHRHKTAKGVAFSEEVDEAEVSSISGSDKMKRTNSGIVHSHHTHNHHFANSDQGNGAPHHVLGADHHARLKESIRATETTATRKLGTWDGVFMPVSLNVSLKKLEAEVIAF
jgi:hypothetical protein